MPQSLAQIVVHIVFSTKHRHPFLSDRDVRAEMHRYIAGICRSLGSPALAVGGVADHVHILCAMSRIQCISVIVREIKRASSHWIKAKGGTFTEFQWQGGYGVFSVGEKGIDGAKRYIDNQEAHHRQRTFKHEYREYLAATGIEYDERYVWD